MFTPIEKKPPKQKAKPGERGTRGVRYQQDEPKRVPRGPGKNRRKNVVLDEPPKGFLVGDPKRAYYDLDGRYVRVRGRKKIVELFGPRRALNALTEQERHLVMEARRRLLNWGRPPYRQD